MADRWKGQNSIHVGHMGVGGDLAVGATLWDRLAELGRSTRQCKAWADPPVQNGWGGALPRMAQSTGGAHHVNAQLAALTLLRPHAERPTERRALHWRCGLEHPGGEAVPRWTEAGAWPGGVASWGQVNIATQ